MACPFTFTYEVFCTDCTRRIRLEDYKVHEGYCRDCDIDLGPALKKNLGRLLVFPLKEQLLNYLGDPTFTAVMRVFSFSTSGKLRGPTHDTIFTDLHIWLKLGIDPAPLSRESALCVYPVVLHVNNLPLSLQHRYPILASLYAGPTASKPTAHRMLQRLQEQVRGLQDEPLSWTDDRNVAHQSFVYITLCHSDAPMKEELQTMVGHNSKFACNYCEYEGETIDVARYPEVFEPSNKFRRTKSLTTARVR